MSIASIDIKDIKSLKKISFKLNDVSCLIGENGSGKSTILKSLKYFYDNLTETQINSSFKDRHNPYNDFVEISVTYDFSRLLMVARNQVLNNNEHNKVFNKIIQYVEVYGDCENLITLTLRQYKNNLQKWNIDNYNFRALIKYFFPVYFIDSRKINLVDWESIWDIIGDLSNTNPKIDNELHRFEEFFNDIYGEGYSRSLKHIRDEFIKHDIGLEKLNNKQKFAHIFQIQFGGKQFKYLENDLDYFSDGINSFNYLKLLIDLIAQISNRSLKETTIIMDEPEIGLHPQYIDKLVNSFSIKSRKVKILVATHSPRMIKNILNQKLSNTMFHLSVKNDYSLLSEMKGFTDSRETNVISEKEASYYFSRGIVFVEGVSEIELFLNTNLNSLFPVLKKVDFYSQDSNNVQIKLIRPDQKNISVPYLILLDLDKILNYSLVSEKINLKDSGLNPLTHKSLGIKEGHYYGYKRDKTFLCRKRIKGIIKNCRFKSDLDWNRIIDKQFDELKNLVKSYCYQYNVAVLDTTVEGGLINSNNIELVYDWLVAYKKPNMKDIIDQIYNYGENASYKTTVLRLIHGGKYDNLTTFKPQKSLSKNPGVKGINEKINLVKVSGKTSGWITEFIDYIFDVYINIPGYSREDKIEVFKANFNELFNVINLIEIMLEKSNKVSSKSQLHTAGFLEN